MDFSQIDKIFTKWAEDNSLPVNTEYKDSEVLSVNIVTPDDAKWQLWLEKSNDDDTYIIHYWDYKDSRNRIVTQVNDLREKLNSIMAALRGAE